MFLKTKLQKIKFSLIVMIGAIFIRLLACTIRVVDRPKKHPEKLLRQGKDVIYAYWHSFILIPVYTARNLGIKVLVSQHRDGEFITQVIERFGFVTIRGSSTRGGTRALLKLVKDPDDRATLAITPDGPRGPRFVVQPGIIFLGQKTGLPIIPVSLGLTNFWELPTWDKLRIPKPFSKAALIYGEPIHIPPKLNKSEMEEYRKLLEEKLKKMNVESEQLVKC